MLAPPGTPRSYLAAPHLDPLSSREAATIVVVRGRRSSFKERLPLAAKLQKGSPKLPFVAAMEQRHCYLREDALLPWW
jgi:hypothetical protein